MRNLILILVCYFIASSMVFAQYKPVDSIILECQTLRQEKLLNDSLLLSLTYKYKSTFIIEEDVDLVTHITRTPTNIQVDVYKILEASNGIYNIQNKQGLKYEMIVTRKTVKLKFKLQGFDFVQSYLN